MNLLKFNNLSTNNFREKSNKVLNSFYKVLDELSEINAQCILKQKELKEQQSLIDIALNELEEINSSNLRVINNIEKIIK